jgi:hypothetical protein
MDADADADADTMEAAIQRAVAAFSPEELAEGFRVGGVTELWNSACVVWFKKIWPYA